MKSSREGGRGSNKGSSLGRARQRNYRNGVCVCVRVCARARARVHACTHTFFFLVRTLIAHVTFLVVPCILRERRTLLSEPMESQQEREK